MSLWPRASLLWFLILQEQALILTIFLALIALPNFVSGDITSAIVVAIVAAEFMLLIDSLGRDWVDEGKTA